MLQRRRKREEEKKVLKETWWSKIIYNKKNDFFPLFVIVLCSVLPHSGASWIMASARLRRSSNLTAAVSSSTSRLELDEPVNSRSDELSSNITAIPSLGDSTVVSRKKSSTDGPSPSIITNATSSESRSQSLKKYSQSSPALPQLHYDLNNLGRSKSRQKKFLRLFPNVPRDEKVLNRKF